MRPKLSCILEGLGGLKLCNVALDVEALKDFESKKLWNSTSEEKIQHQDSNLDFLLCSSQPGFPKALPLVASPSRYDGDPKILKSYDPYVSLKTF